MTSKKSIKSIRRKTRVKEYTVLLIKEGKGFWVQVPALPGCYTTGDTMEKALRNAKDAIETHIIGLEEDGQEVPSEEQNAALLGRVKVAV